MLVANLCYCKCASLKYIECCIIFLQNYTQHYVDKSVPAADPSSNFPKLPDMHAHKTAGIVFPYPYGLSHAYAYPIHLAIEIKHIATYYHVEPACRYMHVYRRIFHLYRPSLLCKPSIAKLANVITIISVRGKILFT